MDRYPLVLIVDDTPSGRKALESLLVNQGYELALAGSGEEALALDERLKPDLILLDVMMPGMDGFDVCRSLRARPGLAEMPVVMVTALDDAESRRAGLESGADDFISKPFNRAELRARVRTITRLNRYHALLEEREKLRQLSQQVIAVQEQERRNLAVELHDEIGQPLTGLKMLVGQARNQASDPSSAGRLDLALGAIGDLIARMRDLSLNLRPGMLDDFGLHPALAWLAGRFREQSGLQLDCNFDESGDRRFPPAMETAAFRIAQEALTNIARHAGASRVRLHLAETPGQLALEIEDDGQGFDLEALRQPGRVSTGLSGMQERARMAGGALDLQSTPGRGTRLTATFPLVVEKEGTQT